MLLPSEPILNQQFAIKSLYEYIHNLQHKRKTVQMLNRQFPFCLAYTYQFILIKFPYNNFANFVK